MSDDLGHQMMLYGAMDRAKEAKDEIAKLWKVIDQLQDRVNALENQPTS